MLDGTAYDFSEPVTGDLTLEASFRAIEGGQGPTDPGQGEQDGLENQGGTPSSPGQGGKPGDPPQAGDIAGLAALAAAAAPALLYAGKRARPAPVAHDAGISPLESRRAAIERPACFLTIS